MPIRPTEKIIATYPVEKFSPFDYESFEFGGIFLSTTLRLGEFAKEAFERAQTLVEGMANIQFNIKRQLFLQHRGWAHQPTAMPELSKSPIVFSHGANGDADEMDDEFFDDDDDEDRAFRPKRTPDAGDKLTVCYGVERFAPRKYESFEIGGQFYTTYVSRKETAMDAYERAWQVLAQVAERQFIVKCRSFHREQPGEPMLSPGAIINQKYLRG